MINFRFNFDNFRFNLRFRFRFKNVNIVVNLVENDMQKCYIIFEKTCLNYFNCALIYSREPIVCTSW